MCVVLWKCFFKREKHNFWVQSAALTDLSQSRHGRSVALQRLLDSSFHPPWPLAMQSRADGSWSPMTSRGSQVPHPSLLLTSDQCCFATECREKNFSHYLNIILRCPVAKEHITACMQPPSAPSFHPTLAKLLPLTIKCKELKRLHYKNVKY